LVPEPLIQTLSALVGIADRAGLLSSALVSEGSFFIWEAWVGVSYCDWTKMRSIFCGNLEYDARQSELERLFGKYGKVDRVDMKSGFAFIYMEDERDADDAIRGLDRREFGRHGRRLRVEWTKQERGGRRSGSERRSPANTRPAKTLFVINFDPINTRMRDLERHFEPYGKVLNVRIRRNFAFIQFESQDDATKALEATNMSKLMDRIIAVEYAVRDDDERKNGSSPDRRGRDRYPERSSRGRERSASPYGRGVERASPDYGRGSSPYSKPEQRGSPNYGSGESPANERHHSRSRSPARQERSRSPARQERSRSPARRERS
ncbi:uncharacterized protein A4U43_C04F30130, partial [Asparagus officinalis]